MRGRPVHPVMTRCRCAHRPWQYDLWRRNRDVKPPVTFEMPVLKHGHNRKAPQRRVLALTGSTVRHASVSCCR